ncbi:hypothetical protein PsorP6_015182 [Peronosclerospora sorghi]|uniref:Uncharacterized protein n=1 Tax=Peronosclerospora sorghi TaxID=230839 RepID=A0ACC0VSK0_9STRA|nr:hypothetical protein PsorP6_015182 [Peronosclerospora sorghi]
MAAADRLTNFDDGGEDEVHDNQDVGENRQNMRDQVDDGHGEDESVSANFGSEVDPTDEGSVADATEVGEDNKEDGKTGPPGHPRLASHSDAAPAGGGFFNLPPPVSKPSGAPPAPALANGYGAKPMGVVHRPVPDRQRSSSSISSSATPSLDLFGGMAVKAPLAASSGHGGTTERYASQPPWPPSGAPPPGSHALGARPHLFSGLDVAPAVSTAGASRDASRVPSSLPATGAARGSYDAASSFASSPSVVSHSSRTLSPTMAHASRPTSSLARASASSKKKKKTKTFRPGFGRQLSDESAAALQRGELNEDELKQQQDTDDARGLPPGGPHPTDLAHLLPPTSSVLQGLTLHAAPRASESSVLAGLHVHALPASSSSSSSSTPPRVDPPDVGPVSMEKNPPLRPLAPAVPATRDTIASPPRSDAKAATQDKAPTTPPPDPLLATVHAFETQLAAFCTLRGQHATDERELRARRAQLEAQVQHAHVELHDMEAQQQHACRVEDFETAEALNAALRRVQHGTTRSTNALEHVTRDLDALHTSQARAFDAYVARTRTLVHELQELVTADVHERTVVHNESTLYDLNQGEQLAHDAATLDAKRQEVAMEEDDVASEHATLETTIADECRAAQDELERLVDAKQAVDEQLAALEQQVAQCRAERATLDKAMDAAHHEIARVRERFAPALARVAAREQTIQSTRAEVEQQTAQLARRRTLVEDKVAAMQRQKAALDERVATDEAALAIAKTLVHVLEAQATRRQDAHERACAQMEALQTVRDAYTQAEHKVETLVRHVERLERARTEQAQAVTDADALLPRYAREKEAAVAERKFQDAARIAQAMKTLEKERGRAEAMVEGVEMELGDVRGQLEASRDTWTKAREARDEQERVWGVREWRALRIEARALERALSEMKDARKGPMRAAAVRVVEAEYEACMEQVKALEKKYNVKEDEQDVRQEAEEGADGCRAVGSETRSRVAGGVHLSGTCSSLERTSVEEQGGTETVAGDETTTKSMFAGLVLSATTGVEEETVSEKEARESEAEARDALVADAETSDHALMADSETNDALAVDSDTIEALVAEAETTNALAADSETNDALAADSETNDALAADSETNDAHAADSDTRDALGTDSDPTNALGADSDTRDALAADSETDDAVGADTDTGDALAADSETTDGFAAGAEANNAVVADLETVDALEDKAETTDALVVESELSDALGADSKTTNALVDMADPADAPVDEADTTDALMAEEDTTYALMTEEHTTETLVAELETKDSLVVEGNDAERETKDALVVEPERADALVVEKETTDALVVEIETTHAPVVESETIETHADEPEITETHVVETDDLFGGLQLSSHAVAKPTVEALTDASSDMFGGLTLSRCSDGSSLSANAVNELGDQEVPADALPDNVEVESHTALAADSTETQVDDDVAAHIETESMDKGLSSHEDTCGAQSDADALQVSDAHA